MHHLKFFPAEALGGVTTLKALSAPYANVQWMPTGGVTQANLPNYFGLPSVFCAGGTWIVPPALVESGDFAQIQSLAAAAVSACARPGDGALERA